MDERAPTVHISRASRREVWFRSSKGEAVPLFCGWRCRQRSCLAQDHPDQSVDQRTQLWQFILQSHTLHCNSSTAAVSRNTMLICHLTNDVKRKKTSAHGRPELGVQGWTDRCISLTSAQLPMTINVNALEDYAGFPPSSFLSSSWIKKIPSFTLSTFHSFSQLLPLVLLSTH